MVKYIPHYTRHAVAFDKNTTYVFNDNKADADTNYSPRSTQAVIRGLPNAIGICTKKNRFTRSSSYLSNADFEWFKHHVDSVLEKLNQHEKVCLPTLYLGTGNAELDTRAPVLFAYLKESIDNFVNNIKIK